jgi:glycosyltransferase involved in cell wall biosynthesis
VVTVHDISFAVRPDFFTRKDRFLLKALVPWSLRRAARIITDVEYTKRDLVRMYNLSPEDIEVIPLAADPRYHPMDRVRCRQIVAERHGISGPFVLYVGTLQPRKNVATLIRAYGMFRERTGLPHKLVLTGKPKYMYQSVLDALNESRFPDDIVLTGFVTDADLPIYYNAAAVFAFPSLYEGFGLPVLEAMACGTPVISSNVTSLPEVAGDAALLVDPREPEAFCDALVQVLGDEEVANRLSQRGLEQAARFTWERTARETLAVYRDVLNRTECAERA